MNEHVIIDGNNLQFAMRDHAPIPHVGRETLARLVDRWAVERDAHVSLVFDGPEPYQTLVRQMAGERTAVSFSAPQSADDVIVEMLHRLRDPSGVRVITSDTAIRYEARIGRFGHTDSVAFVRELFDRGETGISTESVPPPAPSEKPERATDDDRRFWSEAFGGDDEEPFDGHDAMTL